MCTSETYIMLCVTIPQFLNFYLFFLLAVLVFDAAQRLSLFGVSGEWGLLSSCGAWASH